MYPWAFRISTTTSRWSPCLDDATLDRAADAAPLLELARESLQLRIVDRHTRDSGHGLAAATRDLAPDLHAIAVGLALLELGVTRLAQVAVGGRVNDPGIQLHGSDGTGSPAAANENPSLLLSSTADVSPLLLS